MNSSKRVNTGDQSGAKLAFACSWWRPRQPTWSFIPSSLRDGLRATGEGVIDIEAQPPLWLQVPIAGVLTAVGQRPWKYAATYRGIEAYRIRQAVHKHHPDAVLQMADLIVSTAVPSYCFQDMNLAVADHYRHDIDPKYVSTLPVAPDKLRRLADEQCQAMQKMAGIFVMGAWYKDFLVERGILPKNRVHVVGGGINAQLEQNPARHVRERSQRSKILFIGVDFWRKGGDALVEAVKQLRKNSDRKVSLTVVGPPSWPLSNPPPAWIDYKGTMAPRDAAALFAGHDLFVLPSRFEAYGIVLIEALAHGLPCVARDTFAMPDLIKPGLSGLLWNGQRIGDLASAISDALDDDALHERCAQNAKATWQANQWTQVAQRIREQIEG